MGVEGPSSTAVGRSSFPATMPPPPRLAAHERRERDSSQLIFSSQSSPSPLQAGTVTWTQRKRRKRREREGERERMKTWTQRGSHVGGRNKKTVHLSGNADVVPQTGHKKRSCHYKMFILFSNVKYLICAPLLWAGRLK